jgi:hypothetical protein
MATSLSISIIHYLGVPAIIILERFDIWLPSGFPLYLLLMLRKKMPLQSFTQTKIT